MFKKIGQALFWMGLTGLLLTSCAGRSAVQGEQTLISAEVIATLPLSATAIITPTQIPTTPPSTPIPTSTLVPLLPSPPALSLTPTYTPTPSPSPSFTPAPPLPSLPALSPTSTPTSPPLSPPAQPLTRTIRIGLHGRNDLGFQEADYQLVREAGIETLKMLSLTRPEVFARLKQEIPSLEFIVRLYDDRINAEGHPSPQAFAERMSPIIQRLQPYVVKFEVGNEPNHFQGYEGWGPEAGDAEAFNRWFLEVYDLLKTAHPWAEFGFPALGTPDSVHHDRLWLRLNREAIERADWLGVHCYWQTYPDGATTMFDPERGLCFSYYHELFPDKPLELTEFDNDNVIWDIPPLSEEALAAEIVTYYQTLYNYPYLRSASSFILSSPDPTWDYFTWRSETADFKPVVAAVRDMNRPTLEK